MSERIIKIASMYVCDIMKHKLSASVYKFLFIVNTLNPGYQIKGKHIGLWYLETSAITSGGFLVENKMCGERTLKETLKKYNVS